MSHVNAFNQEENIWGNRDFLPAKKDLLIMGELSSMEKVSFMTYNVLSQLGARRLGGVQYGYVEEFVLRPMKRREILLREIFSYDADIMCLQEVDDYDEWWAPHLTSAGYDSIYFMRPGDHDDGLVIAFRRDLFQLFRSIKINLNDLSETILDPNLKAKCLQDNIALIACLQPWENCHIPSALCIVNTQLASAPGLDKVRVLQTEVLCREIEKTNGDFQLPVLFGGTFNALPSSDVYHIIQTGRKRPVPEAPFAPMRPLAVNPTPTSITVKWEKPESKDGPIEEYKVSIKNCTSAVVGFLHEIKVEAKKTQLCVTMLSAGVTYQFKVAAKNAFGWSNFSPPSEPMTTPRSTKLQIALASTTMDKLFIAKDDPPMVQFDFSFGSGYTPRFENQEMNLQVCPRAISKHSTGSSQAFYSTLERQGDRDEKVVHYEVYESAYGNYFKDLSEPELTFSSTQTIGTMDYIFYSSNQLEPFQLLSLPSFDELMEIGQDARMNSVEIDLEMKKKKPIEWKETIHDIKQYMGEWIPQKIPNTLLRQNPWLPNAVYPSDHLALVCVFAIRKDQTAVSWN